MNVRETGPPGRILSATVLIVRPRLTVTLAPTEDHGLIPEPRVQYPAAVVVKNFRQVMVGVRLVFVEDTDEAHATAAFSVCKSRAATPRSRQLSGWQENSST